eukprot:1600196-Amphidinium_carterae.1
MCTEVVKQYGLEIILSVHEAEKEAIEKKRLERAMKRQVAEISDDGAMEVNTLEEGLANIAALQTVNRPTHKHASFDVNYHTHHCPNSGLVKHSVVC